MTFFQLKDFFERGHYYNKNFAKYLSKLKNYWVPSNPAKNSINLNVSSPKENSCFTLTNNKATKDKTNQIEDLFEDSCEPWTINIENWEVNQTENDSF